MPALAPAPPPSTPRFAATRERILDVGSRHINRRGLKGLSLGAVAEEIGLGGSGVTYYYRRKELLAAACYDRALDALAAHVAIAAAEIDARARIARLFALVAEDVAREETGFRFAQMHEMRAMDDPHRATLIGRYFAIFRAARGFFVPTAGPEGRLPQVMQTQILLEVAHLLPAWLHRYAPSDHPRVVRRLTDLLVDGLAPKDSADAAAPTPAARGPDAPGDRFLDAATRLMNERGYRGASVQRIAEALKVTKGSFYHHLDAKDDLALACFRRSLDTIDRSQDAAIAGGGSLLRQISDALARLITIQFGDGTPLLRSTALAAMPPELRGEALDRVERTTRRFAGMIADGITEGSVAAVDPLLAGEVLMSVLNVAIELRDVSRRVSRDRAVALYASILLGGLSAPAA